MFNLISLLAAAALLSLQCESVGAQLDTSKIDLDNSIQPNVVASPPRRRGMRKFVRISTPPPSVAKQQPGTRLELTCEAMGKPAPSIRWLRNDEPLVEYEVETNEIYSPEPSSLARLTSTLVLDDVSGGPQNVYTCVAQSGLKTDSASTTVYSRDDEPEDILTIQKLLSMPAKPRITLFYNDIFQEIGTSVLLPCRAYAYPTSRLFWTDNKDNLIFGGNGRLRVLPSGALLISGLQWSDMGNFSCTAMNKYGEETITTFLYPVKPK